MDDYEDIAGDSYYDDDFADDEDDDFIEDDFDVEDDVDSTGSVAPYADEDTVFEQDEAGDGVLEHLGVGVNGVYLDADEFHDEEETDVMAADKTGTMAALRATGDVCHLGESTATCTVGKGGGGRSVRFSAARPNRSGKRAPPVRFITGPDRRTEPIMTKFEFAAIVGERATLIERDVDDVDEYVARRCAELGIDHALDIAEIELRWTAAPFPMKVHRRVALNVYEVWPVRELKVPDDILYEAFDDESTRVLQTSHAAGSDQQQQPRVDPFEAKVKEIRAVTRFAF